MADEMTTTKAPKGWPKRVSPVAALMLTEASYLPGDGYERVRNAFWVAACELGRTPSDVVDAPLSLTDIAYSADNELFDAHVPEMEELIVGALDRMMPGWKDEILRGRKAAFAPIPPQ